MKTAILAGGRGTRLGCATHDRPKALVTIGDRPILWHIMRGFACQGLTEFVIALGHGHADIERYVTSELEGEDWMVDLVDTGADTATGGRLKRLADALGGDTFLLAWCDGLMDVDMGALVDFHRAHGRLASVVAAPRPSAFGHLNLAGDRVTTFREKPADVVDWVSAGCFALEPGVFGYIAGDEMAWEAEPLEALATDGQLMAYRHTGFWQAMDTATDRDRLEALWRSGNAPWPTRA